MARMIPKKITPISMICWTVKNSLRKITLRIAVSGNSAPKIGSIIAIFPFRRASKSSNAATSVTSETIIRSVQSLFVKVEKEPQTNGVSTAEPTRPLKKSVFQLPTSRVDL